KPESHKAYEYSPRNRKLKPESLKAYEYSPRNRKLKPESLKAYEYSPRNRKPKPKSLKAYESGITILTPDVQTPTRPRSTVSRGYLLPTWRTAWPHPAG